MSQEAMYDSIGGLFESFTDTAAQREIEVRTILNMAGDVRGLDVLDLACGFGFFGRQLKALGANKVVGVDISEKMIDLAKEESARTGDGIEFQVGNACELGKIGQFDMVLAAWLFNYAESRSDLKKMFAAVAANLKPGGRLVAYTVEPDFRLSQGNFTQYGVHVLTEEPRETGTRHEAEFVTTPPSPFTFFRWPREDYEQAIKEAGFSTVTWQKPMLQQTDIQRYRPGFWDIFQSNCLQTGLICQY